MVSYAARSGCDYRNVEAALQRCPSALKPRLFDTDRIQGEARRNEQPTRGGRSLVSLGPKNPGRSLAQGENVAIEAIWSGILAIPVGSLEAGAEMRAHFAMFFELQGGKIRSQHNYDCFQPW